MVEEKIRIEADVKDAVKKIGDLEAAIKDLTEQNKDQAKQLEKAMKTSGDAAKENTKKIGGVRKAIKKLGQGFKGLGLAMKAAGFGLVIKLVDAVTDKMKENQAIVDVLSAASETFSIVLKKVTDIFTPILKQVTESTGGFDALGKVVSGVLSLAFNNFVLTLQGLQYAFAAVKLGWEKMFGSEEDVIAAEVNLMAVSMAAEETTKRISAAASQIGENFSEAVGEVGELATAVVEGAVQVAEEVDLKSAWAQGQVLAGQKKNFELMALQQQRLVEEYDRAAEELRQIRDDETLSIDERIKANEELGKVLDDQIKAEKATIDARIKAIQDEIKLKGKTTELTNELYSLNTELAAVDAKVAGFKSEQLTNQNALIREQNDLINATKEQEAILGVERARWEAEQEPNELKRLGMLRFALEQEKRIEEERLQAKVEMYALGTQARVDAEAELAQRMQELDQEIAANENEQAKIKSENQIKWAELTEEEKMNVISNGFKNLSNVLGEESAAGKAAAIAAATIDTYQSATASYKSLAGVPIIGPALGAAAAAAAVVSGMATVKKITATKTPGGKSAPTPSISAGGGGSQASAPPAFNIVGSSGSNQLAEAIAGQEKKPIKAYVTSNDVTTAQSLDRNIVKGASIGG